jgi:hypothetical protein
MRLYAGIAIGLALGGPLGAAVTWAFRPPVYTVDLPRVPIPRKVAHAVPAAPLPKPEATPVASPPATTAKLEEKQPRPAEPPHAPLAPEKAGTSIEPPSPPPAGSRAHLAILRIHSTPAGAEVSVRGEPRGQAPVDVELTPGHRYDITVTTPGKPPWKKRVNLKPPVTEVNAIFR